MTKVGFDGFFIFVRNLNFMVMMRTLVGLIFLFACGFGAPAQEELTKGISVESRGQTDTLQLKTGWNWLSFPRMVRTQNDFAAPEKVLDKINSFPQIEFTLFGETSVTYKQWNYSMPLWLGMLNTLSSTSGYLLEIDHSDAGRPYIVLEGTAIDPGHELLIGAGETKWIGYFIEEAQYPWHAFPNDLYNGPLAMIKAQYWAMVKDPRTNQWLISGKVQPIKYGDMVKVKTAVDFPVTFQWNISGFAEKEKEISQPVNYTWTEKEDYIPFFIETDRSSDIAEIAVKVDGNCIGASVRNPGDTLVEIDAYTKGTYIGSAIEVDIWNGKTIETLTSNDFTVYSRLTGKDEKRTIYIGEMQEYYLLSLKKSNAEAVPSALSHVTCILNPFSNETTITFRLNGNQRIWVEMYDIAGAKVKTLLNGDLPGGYYEVKWNGDNDSGTKVKEGIYFYKIRTGDGTELTDKIVLID